MARKVEHLSLGVIVYVVAIAFLAIKRLEGMPSTVVAMELIRDAGILECRLVVIDVFGRRILVLVSELSGDGTIDLMREFDDGRRIRPHL